MDNFAVHKHVATVGDCVEEFILDSTLHSTCQSRKPACFEQHVSPPGSEPDAIFRLLAKALADTVYANNLALIIYVRCDDH
jgi:hypothetical protein